MSAVAGTAGLRALGPIVWDDLGDLLDPLSDAERRDVRNVLAMVARALAERSDDLGGLRVRLDSVITGLIGGSIRSTAIAIEKMETMPRLSARSKALTAMMKASNASASDADGVEQQGLAGLAERLHLMQGPPSISAVVSKCCKLQPQLA